MAASERQGDWPGSSVPGGRTEMAKKLKLKTEVEVAAFNAGTGKPRRRRK